MTVACGHTRYLRGCDTCRSTRVAYNKRWQADVARSGPRRVDGRRWQVTLGYLRRAGVQLRLIAEMAGLSADQVERIAAGRQAKVRRATAARLTAALDELLVEWQERLDDARSSLDVAAGRAAERRWLSEPLRARIVEARLTSRLDERDRRALYRQDLSGSAVERICDTTGVDPRAVWAEWPA